jgi:transposase
LIISHKVEMPDGSTVVTEKCITYKRDWSKYNDGQCDEKGHVQVLLRSLCDGIVQPPYAGNGRPRLPLGDIIYGATTKVFTGKSARRAKGDIEECHKLGHLEAVPSFNSVFRYMEDPAITPLLQVLIAESAEPLVACETEQQYAVDATGFATGVYGGYCENKHEKQKRRAKYIKAHVIAGTHTHVVTYVEPTEGHVNDCRILPKLVAESASRYPMAEVSADKGYLSKLNAEVIAKYGAVPYISFKDNSKGRAGPKAWRAMWHHFEAERDDYLAHYHRRSNVETVFHMVKAKFGERLKSRTLTAQYNEILLKYLCHNLSCLAMAIHTLGLDPKFERLFASKEAA